MKRIVGIFRIYWNAVLFRGGLVVDGVEIIVALVILVALGFIDALVI